MSGICCPTCITKHSMTNTVFVGAKCAVLLRSRKGKALSKVSSKVYLQWCLPSRRSLTRLEHFNWVEDRILQVANWSLELSFNDRIWSLNVVKRSPQILYLIKFTGAELKQFRQGWCTVLILVKMLSLKTQRWSDPKICKFYTCGEEQEIFTNPQSKQLTAIKQSSRRNMTCTFAVILYFEFTIIPPLTLLSTQNFALNLEFDISVVSYHVRRRFDKYLASPSEGATIAREISHGHFVIWRR